jgi:hypothetical protein
MALTKTTFFYFMYDVYKQTCRKIQLVLQRKLSLLERSVCQCCVGKPALFVVKFIVRIHGIHKYIMREKLGHFRVKSNVTYTNHWALRNQGYLTTACSEHLDLRERRWATFRKEELHNLYSSPNIITVIKTCKIRCTAHTARVTKT